MGVPLQTRGAERRGQDQRRTQLGASGEQTLASSGICMGESHVQVSRVGPAGPGIISSKLKRCFHLHPNEMEKPWGGSREFPLMMIPTAQLSTALCSMF